MSDTNQELVRALKQLSKQYEQQFNEVTEQVNVLAEQIILLTETKSSSSNSDSSSKLSEILTPEQQNSPCSNCKNSHWFSNPKGIGLNFKCLISDVNGIVGYCSQQDSN
jgi:hypothetical protein